MRSARVWFQPTHDDGEVEQPRREGKTISLTLEGLDAPVAGDDHIRGGSSASVTLVEYGEFECPDCGRAYHVIKELLEQSPRELRFVFRHFARDDVHPFAERAAEAAEAAGMQGSFWEMHDLLFEHQHQLERLDLLRYAEELRLDVERFERDLTTRVYLPKVRAHLRTGLSSGVVETPSLFIDGVRYTGSIERDELLTVIRATSTRRRAISEQPIAIPMVSGSQPDRRRPEDVRRELKYSETLG